MRKYFLLLVGFWVLSTVAKAQYVGIPDSSLRYWLQQNYPNCMNGYMLDTTCTGILNATSISPAVDSNITGLQYFKSARILSLVNINGNMYGYNPVRQLIGKFPPNLTELDINNSDVLYMPSVLPASLRHLSLMSSGLYQFPDFPSGLHYLDIGFNSDSLVGTDGYSPPLPPAWPSGLDTLYAAFDFFENQSFPTLPQNLVDFETPGTIYFTLIKTFPSSLQILDLDGSFDLEEDAFPDTFQWPPNLVYLDCGGQFFDADSLPLLPNTLQTLIASSMGLSQAPTYPPTLTYLDLSSNFITAFPPFPAGLGTLLCNKNPNTTLPGLPSSLTELTCGGPSFTTLPALPVGLTQLICDNSPITSLPSLPGSLYDLEVAGDTSLTCFPPLPASIEFLIYNNTGINCLPNYPALSYNNSNSLPLCDINSGCQSNWNISGSVYFNSGANCTHQSGEPLLHPVKMNLWQGGNLVQQVYAPGLYSFKTNYNNYTVEIDTASAPFDFSCSYDSTLTISPSDSMQVVNFEAHCKNGFDLGVNNIVAGGIFFPGDTTPVYISAGDITQSMYGVNCNTVGLSGQVQVTISGFGSYAGVPNGALAPGNVNGNIITWNVNDFSQSNGRYNILIKTATNANASDEICFDMSITPAAGDNNPANNTASMCFATHNSFDPNYKEVSPQGGLTYPYTDWLTYTVHFQNTGNAAAHNITVIDTLDSNIDPTSFQLLAYSYEPTVQITGRYVTFIFEQIMLPDSADNPQGSTGYVQYRVKPLASLNIGTPISNQAYIYFDYNTPVTTNSATNTIMQQVCFTDPTNLNTFICAGSSYSFNGIPITGPGTYIDTLINGNGCDSIVTMVLTVLPIDSTSMNATICTGDTFPFFGINETTGGSYSHTLQNVNGCDSVITLNLTILLVDSSSMNATVCTGDTFPFFGINETTGGSYSHTLQNINGCDSVVTLYLIVLPPDSSSLSAAICTGDTFPFFGTMETTGGDYTTSMQNQNGCYSVVTLHLTVYPPATPPVLTAADTTICPADSTIISTSGYYSAYLWNTGATTPGIYAGTSGSYYVQVTDTNGCKAVSNQLYISVYPQPGPLFVVQGDTLAAFGDVAYQWYFDDSLIPGAISPVYVATRSGYYAVQTVDGNGCVTHSSDTYITVSGIHDLATDEQVLLYPNPSTGSWQLTVGNSLLGSALEVYDDEGRLVFHSKLSTQNSKLELQVPSGVYYLRISNDNVSAVRKLVKL